MVDEFPRSPRSSTGLRIGDLVAVPVGDGTWGCLQVTDLVRSGPGARTALWVAVLPWRGRVPPTAPAVAGATPSSQFMTRVEIFTEGGLQVTGRAPALTASLPGGRLDTTRHVRGWRAAISSAVEIASSLRVS